MRSVVIYFAIAIAFFCAVLLWLRRTQAWKDQDAFRQKAALLGLAMASALWPGGVLYVGYLLFLEWRDARRPVRAIEVCPFCDRPIEVDNLSPCALRREIRPITAEEIDSMLRNPEIPPETAEALRRVRDDAREVS